MTDSRGTQQQQQLSNKRSKRIRDHCTLLSCLWSPFLSFFSFSRSRKATQFCVRVCPFRYFFLHPDFMTSLFCFVPFQRGEAPVQWHRPTADTTDAEAAKHNLKLRHFPPSSPSFYDLMTHTHTHLRIVISFLDSHHPYDVTHTNGRMFRFINPVQ